jgi:hypothetical protein
MDLVVRKKVRIIRRESSRPIDLRRTMGKIVRSSAGPARPVGVSPIGFAWFFLAAPRRWSSNQPTPAVDRQYGPGDESIAHQEDHCRGHLFRAADTPDRQRGPAREDRFALGAE